MAIVKLEGSKDVYLYDPANKGTTLKSGGKFSNVYIGIKTSNKDKVLIKQLNPLLLTNPYAVKRFSLESYTNNLNARIPRVIESISQGHNLFLIKQYIPGISLDYILKEKLIRPSKRVDFIARCVVDILKTLDSVHKIDIIHRDIRPANIIVAFEDGTQSVNQEQPQCYIIDFGMAKYERVSNIVPLKKTPFALIYSPPEQLLNFPHLTNKTSDLYALAASLYELIAGSYPFYHRNPEVLMNLQLTQYPEKVKKMPEILYMSIIKAMQKPLFQLPPSKYPRNELEQMIVESQQKRFQNANDFKKAILLFLTEKNERQRKRWKIF